MAGAKPNRGRRGRGAVTLAACWLWGVGLPGGVAAGPESGDGVVRFVYADSAASAVHLVGDFNGWSPTATPLDREADGTWRVEVFLDPGAYEYKFFVDEAWVLDPDNPQVSENGNSVVRIGAGGSVLPPGDMGPAAGTPGAAGAPDLRWSVRYLGFMNLRRQPELHRWDLDRPLHDVDLRLELDVDDDLSGWFLTNFNTRDEGEALSGTRLRYDRGLVLWKPQEFEVRLLDNEGVTDFEDPGALVGRIGIYQDSFGYRRRGVLLRRRLLGAPLEFLYADNTEAATDSVLAPALPDTAAPAGSVSTGYAALDTRRNGDTFAMRIRAGTESRGLGFGLRLDRGMAPGLLTETTVGADSAGPYVRGRQVETTESWDAWNVDLRLPLGGVQCVAEYMHGTRHAEGQRQQVLEASRIDSTTGTWDASFAPVTPAEESFELGTSRRALLTLAPGADRHDWHPSLRYAYEDHDYDARVTGTAFRMRRHDVSLALHAHLAGVDAQLDVGQEWFDMPQGATWETQFWFRRHNPWLDESTADYARFVLLGVDRAARARVELTGTLWAARHLEGTLRCTAMSPGFDRAPRAVETVVRLGIDVAARLRLRTHSRFATFRRFTTADPDIVAQLGPGAHIEAGELASADIPAATHDYRTYGAHFVELVYDITDRSDIALGFGVDPYVVYEVRNTYMDIGWEQFLFDNGASPQAAFADPVGLPTRMAAAETALALERRLVLEARIHF